MVKSLSANAGDIRDIGLIPGLGRSPGGECGNPLQYSCLENHMDTVAGHSTVHRVVKSQTQLKQLSMHTCSACLGDGGVGVWEWGMRGHVCSGFNILPPSQLAHHFDQRI